MNRTADVVIVGAGVIGSATAFELAKRGYKTLNIDKLVDVEGLIPPFCEFKGGCRTNHTRSNDDYICSPVHGILLIW